jgi:hypothetical protein
MIVFKIPEEIFNALRGSAPQPAWAGPGQTRILMPYKKG